MTSGRSYTRGEIERVLTERTDEFAERFAAKIRQPDALPSASLRIEPSRIEADGSVTVDNPAPLVEYVATVIGRSSLLAVQALLEVLFEEPENQS